MQTPIINPETLLPLLTTTGKKSFKKFGQSKGWEMYYWYTLYRLALTRYHWDNLPEGVPSYWIEMQLLDGGYLAAIKDQDSTDPLFVKVTAKTFNMYDQPNTLHVMESDRLPKLLKYDYSVNDDEIVTIKDSTLNYPIYPVITHWAIQLGNIMNKFNANLRTIVTPMVIKGNARDIKIWEDMYKKALDGEPIFLSQKDSSKSFSDHYEQLQLNQNYYGDQLIESFKYLWQQALQQLGINSVEIEKKERLISDEVNANNDVISRFVDEGLEWRQEAVDKINSLFGTKITVSANANNSKLTYENEEKRSYSSETDLSQNSEEGEKNDAKNDAPSV